MSKTPKSATSFADALMPFLDPSQHEDDRIYYADLGKFIVAYATAEGAVHQLARYLTGITDAKARVLFAGSRIGDVQSRVRALLSVNRRSPQTCATIKDCLDHFTLIGLQRDKLVHRFVNYQNGGFLITNVGTAKSLASIESEIIPAQTLVCMQCDCLLICFKLYRISNAKHFNEVSSGTARKALKLPWFYKPAGRQNRRKPFRARSATQA